MRKLAGHPRQRVQFPEGPHGRAQTRRSNYKLVSPGIVIDTVTGELRLPADKLEHLQTLLQQWGGKTTCTRKELESLIGLLNHACKVVRSFLRRMLDLLHAVPAAQPIIRLNTSFRSDLTWWTAFIQRWNEISFLPPPSLV
jgi:hypothetical protein